MKSASFNSMPFVLQFLRCGGRINGSALQFGERALGVDLRARDWHCLAPLGSLLHSGASLTRIPEDGYLVQVPGGALFEVPTSEFVSTIGLLADCYVREQHACLDVFGKVVLDVGANIGDTAIYFARRGARHVYAYEPFAAPYGRAMRNVSLNDLDHEVTLYHSGVGTCGQTVTGEFMPEWTRLATTVGNNNQPAVDGLTKRTESVQLRALTKVLTDISQKHPNTAIVCKIDCEGCEDHLLGGEGISEALAPVTAIYLEFHNGSDHLVSALARLGFSRVATFGNANEQPLFGQLLATRQTLQ